MSTPTHPTPTIDSLLRVIEVRDSEVALLKLMVDKLKLQLLRRERAEFGTSSEQLAAQITLIDIAAVQALPASVAPASIEALTTHARLSRHRVPVCGLMYRPGVGWRRPWLESRGSRIPRDASVHCGWHR